jgi:N-glycosylase/DNA lyase
VAREWLVANINGMSYKEASHFLRNIGMGQDLAILDRHILKNLVRLGVIQEIPSSISPRKYLDIEEKMRRFCTREKIPMDHLDMLLWCRETGEIFK